VCLGFFEHVRAPLLQGGRPLKIAGDGVWVAEVTFPSTGIEFEYKYIYQANGAIVKEEGPRRSVGAKGGVGTVQVVDRWCAARVPGYSELKRPFFSGEVCAVRLRITAYVLIPCSSLRRTRNEYVTLGACLRICCWKTQTTDFRPLQTAHTPAEELRVTFRISAVCPPTLSLQFGVTGDPGILGSNNRDSGLVLRKVADNPKKGVALFEGSVLVPAQEVHLHPHSWPLFVCGVDSLSSCLLHLLSCCTTSAGTEHSQP
jgi:hypothetical protein